MEHTFKEWETIFHAYLLTEKRCASNTVVAYQKDIRQFMAFLQEKQITTFQQVSAATIQDFFAYMYAMQSTARTVSRKLSAIKLFFSYLHKRHGIKNCSDEVSFPKIEQKLPHFLTEDEIQILLRVAMQDASPVGVRNRVMIYLLYVTGMRISELLGLKKEALSFEEHVLCVDGKGGKQRIIPIPVVITHMIQKYLQHEYCALTDNKQTPLLFPTQYTGVLHGLSRQAFWKMLNNMCVKAGIQKRVSPHQLRHSFATHMLKRGIDLRSLQVLLGHENITTVQIYTHVETSHLRSIYDKRHPRS